MPCALSINPAGPYIEAAYTGFVPFNELMHSRQSILTMARLHQLNKLLVEKRHIEGGHSLGDLFLLVNWLVLQQEAAAMREAVVIPVNPSLHQCCEFWETACTNRGLAVRIFDSGEQAVAWLTAAESTH